MTEIYKNRIIDAVHEKVNFIFSNISSESDTYKEIDSLLFQTIEELARVEDDSKLPMVSVITQALVKAISESLVVQMFKTDLELTKYIKTNVLSNIAYDILYNKNEIYTSIIDNLKDSIATEFKKIEKVDYPDDEKLIKAFSDERYIFSLKLIKYSEMLTNNLYNIEYKKYE